MAIRAAIVTPTLDLEMGQRAVKGAAKKAGVECVTHVVLDTWNEGAVKPANVALKWGFETELPYIVYINDDTSYPQWRWLKRMIEALESNKTFGIAGPSGHCGTAPQNRGKRGMPRGIQIVDRLSFFCAVIKRSVMREVGYFDPAFVHYGCDGDYCIRTQRTGKNCIWVQDVYVKHDRSQTVKHWKARDVATFRKKHGGL